MPSVYSETLRYLYERLPMFQRIGAAAYKADLDNTLAICRQLGNPEKKFRSIHIAGTNGKGSTSHMLASILQCSGLKVGLYTSPHLKDFRERIRINGKMIPRVYVTAFVEKHKKAFEKIEPSFFEWTVGLAFDYFSEEEVDIAVIETGLGGRLDSTNVITPLLSIVTNISYDHMNLLGDTLSKIATEKAGIIKPGIPVVIGETQEESVAVFLRSAKKNRSAISFADACYEVKVRSTPITGTKQKPLLLDIYTREGSNKKHLFLKGLESDLAGLYQQKNIATVLKALESLEKSGFDITMQDIRRGIAEVKKRTGLRGRWEQLSDKPLTIADTGHNEAGIREVLNQLKRVPHEKLLFVLGMVGDKDIRKILTLLPRKSEYFFCKASVPRAMDAAELAGLAAEVGLKGTIYSTVRKALYAAQAQAGKNDLVFVGGSTFTVADALR
jgi:dihydrofolate synthase/folylpolyglutamate synthase